MNAFFVVFELFLTVLPVVMPLGMFIMMARRGLPNAGLLMGMVTIPMALFIGANFYGFFGFPDWAPLVDYMQVIEPGE